MNPIFSKIPLDVMALSPHICDKVDIRWLSIRHGCSGEFNSNLIVLKRTLEILFIMSSLLRKPRNQWMKYHDLAVQLEYGLPELKTLIDSKELDKYQTVKYFVNEIEEILEKGNLRFESRYTDQGRNIVWYDNSFEPKNGQIQYTAETILKKTVYKIPDDIILVDKYAQKHLDRHGGF